MGDQTKVCIQTPTVVPHLILLPAPFPPSLYRKAVCKKKKKISAKIIQTEENKLARVRDGPAHKKALCILYPGVPCLLGYFQDINPKEKPANQHNLTK